MKTNEIPAGAVVVGVDGSPDADHAVDWAAEHAANENRELVLVYGSGAPATTLGWMTSGGMDPSQFLDDLDSAGQAILDAALARIGRDRPVDRVHTAVVRSDPRKALLDASERASLVVVGSRGHGPVATLLLGSVGAAVVRHSHCPVVVVRPHHPGKVRRGVLVAVDGSAGSAGVLDFAFRQASEKGLPLTLLHTEWEAFERARTLDPADPDFQETALTLAQAVAGLGEKYPDVPVTKVLMRGTPKDAVLGLADAMNLVVMGHGRQDAVSRALFGSVALSVVEHAETVVAVVPQP